MQSHSLPKEAHSMVSWGYQKRVLSIPRKDLRPLGEGLPVPWRLENQAGLRWWLQSKESACQCRRHRFDPWSSKIPKAAEQLSPCAATVESVLWSVGAATLQPRATDPVLSARQATAARILCTATSEQPPPPQLEKSPRGNKDTARPNRNKLKKKKECAPSSITARF